MKRVAITGLGLITPLGVNVESTWNSLIFGRSGLKRIASFDVTEFPCKVAGEVKDFNPYDFFDKQSEKKMGRYSQFALAAGNIAIETGAKGLSKDVVTACASGNSLIGDAYEAIRSELQEL